MRQSIWDRLHHQRPPARPSPLFPSARRGCPKSLAGAVEWMVSRRLSKCTRQHARTHTQGALAWVVVFACSGVCVQEKVHQAAAALACCERALEGRAKKREAENNRSQLWSELGVGRFIAKCRSQMLSTASAVCAPSAFAHSYQPWSGCVRAIVFHYTSSPAREGLTYTRARAQPAA